MAATITRRELGFGLAASVFGRTGFAQDKRPNIVIFLADDLGFRDVSCFDCPDIKTPVVDGIAKRGVRFINYYSNAPECTPSRTALLTGRYQQRVGGLECAIGVGNVGRYDDAEWLEKRGELGLPQTELTFPKLLQKAGYATAIFGKWHLGYGDKFRPDKHGFDTYLSILGGNADYFTHKEEDGTLVLNNNGKPDDRKGYVTDIFAEEAIKWLKQRDSRPFFLYVPFTAPHTPIQDPDAFDESKGTAPWQNKNRPVYAKMVERMDRRIGDVLKQISAMGRGDNTIVLFMSDNGADPNGNNGELRGRKSFVWEGGIKLPCVMSWPDRIPKGKNVAQLTMGMDFAPTFLRAAGITPPANLDGMDIMPFVTGAKAPQPRTVFWRYKRAKNVRKAVREGDLKLVIDDGQEELHDIARDPTEKNNLLPAAKTDADRLRKKLAAWEREVMAPRLRPFRSEPG